MLTHVPRLLSLLLLLALVAVGCPDPTEPTPDSGPGPLVDLDAGALGGDSGSPADSGLPDVVPPDPDALAEELCLAYRRGLVNAQLHSLQALTLPTSRCSADDPLIDIATSSELAELPPGSCTLGDELRRLFVVALEGGRVDIDPAAFRACMERGRAVRAMYEVVGEISQREGALLALASDPACQGALTPLVEEGGACAQAWDCVAPLRCEADPIDGNALACLPPALEGERCAEAPPDGQQSARTCAAGTTCVLSICTRRVDENEPCDPAGVPCAEGLVCSPEAVCAPPGPMDAPCAADLHCEEGLVCAPGGTCAPATALLADGEPCVEGSPPCAGLCSVCRPDEDTSWRCLDRGDVDDPCASLDHCREGLYCATDTSRCAPYRRLGEACDGDDPCEGGLACTDQDPPGAPADAGVAPADGGVVGPTCRPLPAVGEACQPGGPYVCGEGTCLGEVCRAGVVDDPCTGDGTCEGELICVQGLCARPPRAGAACSVDGRCEDGAYCDGERCRPFPGPGAACAPGGRCAEGAFCNQGSCEALRIPGATCTSDDSCASGLCLDTGTCATRGASCYSSEDVFTQLLGLSLALPVVGRLRRRRRR